MVATRSNRFTSRAGSVADGKTAWRAQGLFRIFPFGFNVARLLKEDFHGKA